MSEPEKLSNVLEELEAARPAPPPPRKNVAEAEAQSSLIVFSIVGYATCSSLMLVMNKVIPRALATLPVNAS